VVSRVELSAELRRATSFGIKVGSIVKWVIVCKVFGRGHVWLLIAIVTVIIVALEEIKLFYWCFFIGLLKTIERICSEVVIVHLFELARTLFMSVGCRAPCFGCCCFEEIH
jgi:hypothetical protein